MMLSLMFAAICALAWTTAPVETVGKPGLNAVSCPAQEWTYADPAFSALPGAKAYFGRYDGGLYRIEIPENWNGELMLSAHGFTTNSGERGSLLRVGEPLFRPHLVERGFAWAASSYRCNGYVPGVGLLDTMALTELVTKFSGGRAPSRVYLTGTSMGGHVTLLGMHEFPTAFAGALAMCPAGPELFDYFTAVGAAAEVVTGFRFTSPATVRDVTARMTTALGTPPEYTERGRQLASVQIELSGGPRPFAMEGLTSRFLQNVSGGALAGVSTLQNRAVTNQRYTYRIDEALGLTSERLNATVRWKAPDMSVRNTAAPNEELVPFDGQIARPVVTMHGTGDLFVPIHLERALRQAVTAAGHDNLLVQRIYRIPGHCGFNAGEQARSFDDLVRWVHDGVRPQGDNIWDDLRDAGRTFTNPLRDGDPGTLSPMAAPGEAGRR
jgi:pimeloyl-ACP methyl ester carboxylesterase